MGYELVFDRVIVKRLKKLSNHQKSRIAILFDKLEEFGPSCGKLIDSKCWLDEMKTKRPSFRLYYTCSVENEQIYVLEVEIKKSTESQKKSIEVVKSRIRDLFWNTFYVGYCH